MLAIGGGSVIDTAKSICASYYYDGDPFDLNLHKAKPTKALPLGVVLTISASGSELSDSCVVMDDKTKRSNHLIPINNVIFREAWEVGLNDIDSVAVLPDDDPIIPDNHQCDAPVLEVLRKKRSNNAWKKL